MRHIPQPLENESPRIFQRWKNRHRGAKYARLKDGDVKKAIKEALISRQKFICCYCETRISRGTSHIEHIEPQLGGLSAKTLDFSNMAASCIREPKKGDYIRDEESGVVSPYSTIHCGHARGSHRVISPYDAKCESLFSYSFSGEISVNPDLTEVADKNLAQDSITYLNLNSESLIAMRKIAMLETVKMLEKGIAPADILRELSGKLPPFYSAAKTAAQIFNSSRNTVGNTANS